MPPQEIDLRPMFMSSDDDFLADWSVDTHGLYPRACRASRNLDHHISSPEVSASWTMVKADILRHPELKTGAPDLVSGDPRVVSLYHESPDWIDKATVVSSVCG